ncbi:tapetum determinant protein [Perilla frutescens var. hirtella]|uniref:Tapetum determinant protein n=1 Tax=Perilla frutescens var. hirtella TaxID=608512 RepID=A0AAD4P942_PERFH|nr:tapetum determinant protein [Perilla frutescens var. hirtella]
MIRESLSSLRQRSLASFTAVFAVTLLLLIIGIYTDGGFMEFSAVVSEKNNLLFLTHRKLLNDGKRKGDKNENENGVEPNRIWSDKCSKSDIVISQGATEPLPNGIPTYTVEIMNTCVSGCDITAIHLSCGWFSSARLVNPHVFKRLRVGDCLVNDGKPLLNGRTLSFKYANTFRYPLSVSSVSC